jgi:hypothetical protein
VSKDTKLHLILLKKEENIEKCSMIKYMFNEEQFYPIPKILQEFLR